MFESFHVSVHELQQYDEIVKVGLSIRFIIDRMMNNGNSDIKFIWVSPKNPFFWIFGFHMKYEWINLILKLLRFGSVPLAKERLYPIGKIK
jgi:hypothetical protein